MLAVSLLMILMYGNCSAAEDGITVKIGGEIMEFSDQGPVIINDRTLVPMRAIFEKMGAVIDWQEDTQTVIAQKGDIAITIQLGSTTAIKNGKNITMDVPAQVINNRTMVPLRFVGESLGASVEWIAATETVEIKVQPSTSTPAPTTPTPTTPAPTALPSQAGQTTSSEGYSAVGTWKESSLKGANPDLKTYYTNDKTAYAMWNPNIKDACQVKVYVYKIAYESSKKQKYEIYHGGTVDTKTIDFFGGKSDWVLLGVYDFKGTEQEYVKLLCSGDTARAGEVKFEIASGKDVGKVIQIEQAKK